MNPEGENLKNLVNSMNDYLRPQREEAVLALQEFTRNKSLWALMEIIGEGHVD